MIVIGAGAMGAIFGSALARAGCDVAFCERRPEVVAAIRDPGLQLTGVMGDTTCPYPASTNVADLGRADMVLVQVDSSATPDAARRARDCLTPQGFALTLQNGIGNWEALAHVLGNDRVAAGSTYNSGAALGPGRVLHSNLGPTELGEIDGTISERCRTIAGLLSKAGLPTQVSSNAVGVVWSKFVHNCAINPVSALTGLRPGDIARDPAAAHLLDLVLDEVLAVVAAAGVRLPEEDPRHHIRDHCWERYNRPSMLQHLEGGRRTEIDALNGALVERARQLAVPAPVNEAIVLAIRAREARAASPRPEAESETVARSDPRGDRWG
ncbi:MAG: 2-dehydropantoate 2-reductase [Alsobacter sp.]